MFAVMIQDDEYVVPRLCFDGSTYKSKEEAQEMLQYLIDEGFPGESYFIVEIKRVD